MFEQMKQPKYLDPKWTPMANKFWCAYCIDPTTQGLGWITASSLAYHLQQDHGIAVADQRQGIDSLSTEELWVALQEKHSNDAKAIDRALRWLDSIRGPDDLITDCG